jgi:NitT/TauT family transport system substrate-binding protein
MNIFVRVLVLLTLSALAAGCSKKSELKASAGQLQKIRFASLNVSEASIPIQLGIKKGFFAEQGVELDIKHFLGGGGGSESVTALAAGEIDMGSAGTPILVGASAGVPVKIVGSPAHSGQPFILISRPGYNSIKDLKGKKISIGKPGNGTRQAFIAIARANGLDINDFQNFDAGGSGAGFAALQAGSVEAVITTDLNAAKAEMEGFGKVLARADQYYGRYQHNFFFASQRFIDQHPEAVKGYLAGYRKAAEYIRANPEEAIRFGVKELELDEKSLRRVLASQIKIWDTSGKVDLPGTDNAIAKVKELGEIDPKSPLTAVQIVDERFLPR